MTRHEIQILRAVKMAQRTIAVETGVSVRSVFICSENAGSIVARAQAAASSVTR